MDWSLNPPLDTGKWGSFLKLTKNNLKKSTLENLERLALFHHLSLPKFPREWSGYKRALIKRLANALNINSVQEVWRKN